MFPDWNGDAQNGGLSSQALVRVDIDGTKAKEAARYEWGERVRETEQGPDGALWVLEDGSGGRLLRLTPGS
jgi:glucose/arabinose dehydrogenase